MDDGKSDRSGNRNASGGIWRTAPLVLAAVAAVVVGGYWTGHRGASDTPGAGSAGGKSTVAGGLPCGLTSSDFVPGLLSIALEPGVAGIPFSVARVQRAEGQTVLDLEKRVYAACRVEEATVLREREGILLLGSPEEVVAVTHGQEESYLIWGAPNP